VENHFKNPYVKCEKCVFVKGIFQEIYLSFSNRYLSFCKTYIRDEGFFNFKCECVCCMWFIVVSSNGVLFKTKNEAKINNDESKNDESDDETINYRDFTCFVKIISSSIVSSSFFFQGISL